MSSFFRISLSLLFPIAIASAAFAFDLKISKDSSVAFQETKSTILDNVLNEREISLGVNDIVKIIRISPFEFPDSESSFLLRYKIPFLRKEGYPEQLFTISIN